MEHAEERVRERAVARQRAEDRRRRLRSGAVWAMRLILPLLGAAAVLAAFAVAGGDLGSWSAAAAAAVLLVPALISAALARGDGALAAVLWLLVTLAAEVALVFAVGFAVLGLGPD